MAAIEVTITGALYDKTSRTMRPVVLIGEASLTGIGVGGGPIQPPEGGGGGGPPGIWGPTDPRPSPPIAGIPGVPGAPDQQPHPEHPIELPPNLPPETGEGRPIDWRVAWLPQDGWAVVGVPQFPHPAPSRSE